VGGIDATLFVVAADEGVMPQTREHLAILDLLQVGGGVVALTKIDMVDDPDWLDLVEEDLRTVLAGSILADAPIVRVSGKSGAGISELVTALADTLSKRPARPDLGRPRLPVDRVFTISGFGTVVTGTLTDGRFEVGQEIVIQPGGIRGRIRGLQSHNQKEQVAVPGSRTAVNISGVNVGQVKRGAWITRPGQYRPTRRVDVQFRQLPDVTRPVKHNMEIKFFIGAAEVVGRVRLLGADSLPPGGTGWLQIELREPVVAVRGDGYILRRPSPGETLGGGMVVDPHPRGRHKRFARGLIERLEALAEGTPQEVLLQAALSLEAAAWREVVERSSLSLEAATEALADLLDSGEMIVLENGDLPSDSAQESLSGDALVIPALRWNALAEEVVRAVSAYHEQNPLRIGAPREELKSRLRLDSRLFNALVAKLVKDGKLQGRGALLWHSEHEVRFSEQQQQAIAGLMRQFEARPYTPPGVKEAQTAVGPAVYQALIDLERLVQVSPDVVFRKEDFAHLVEETRKMIARTGGITVAEFRDHFRTSRKYALAFLEYLDSIGVTVRDGDVRKLRGFRG